MKCADERFITPMIPIVFPTALPALPAILEQIELQAKLLNYFLGSNKSNINQNAPYHHAYVFLFVSVNPEAEMTSQDEKETPEQSAK